MSFELPLARAVLTRASLSVDLFPLEIINEESEGVRQRLGSEKKAYQGIFDSFELL